MDLAESGVIPHYRSALKILQLLNNENEGGSRMWQIFIGLGL
jgi:hypothetical protein